MNPNKMAASFRRMFVLLLIQSMLETTSAGLQKRTYNFPFRDPLRNNETPIKKTTTSKELAVCSRCNGMFRLSEKEFHEKKSEKKFCIRLLQILRCIQKLNKYNPQCHGISLMVLNSGVNIKKNKLNCSKWEISPNDVVNIYREIRKTKVSQADKCKFDNSNKNLTGLMHCGMFGDPHIKTFNDVRQTCIVEGAWELLNNDHMTIQVTNEILQTTQTTSATASTKISVIFKEVDSKCSSQKIYEATSNYLPNVFKDASYFTGPTGCRTEVLKETSDEVSIRSCSLATIIIIRRVGNYLTFNIQTPFLLANKSSGLCNAGCPSSELVDYKAYFKKHVSTIFSEYSNDGNPVDNSVEENMVYTSPRLAIKTCESSNLTDFYFDSCVFDLLTTGDHQFSKAAVLAMNDAKLYDPKLRLRRENSIVIRTLSDSKDEISNISSAASTLFRVNRTLVILFSFLITLLLHRFSSR